MTFRLSTFAILFFTISLYSQDNLVIDDRTGLLTDEIAKIVTGKLAEDNISYTTTVDYSSRCNYYFSKLVIEGEDVVATVEDCDNTLLGSKNLGNRILSSSTDEQGLLISYALLDMVSNPGKYVTIIPSSPDDVVTVNVQIDSAVTSDHNSRYFFAPSAYNLKKGELYYNTVYFLLHDVQYGVSDNFSMGIGTSVIGIPIYLTPKVSFPIGKKSAVAIGDMLLFGTWGTNAMGNLLYGSFSTGGDKGNITLGAGHLYTNDSDITSETSSLVTNVNAMARLSPFIYLITENYVLSLNVPQTASVYGPNDYYTEEFDQRNTIWYGISGIRIVTKNRNHISWQLGLTYVLTVPGEIPAKYASWDTNVRTEANLIAFPTVTLTVKFGNKY
jgi:hypothetical protein